MNVSPPQVESLSGLDGAFLNLETLATPMHVGSLHTFEVPPGYDKDFFTEVKTLLAQRMVPVLRRRLGGMPLQFANPVWLDGEVDLDQHIERIQIPSPGEREQLETVVANLHADLLNRSRPLWMMYVLDGLASGERAYYFKIHHAMLDGEAARALAAALFDTAPRALVADAAALAVTLPVSRPGALQLAAAAFRHDAIQYVKLVRQLPEVVRTLTTLVRGRPKRSAPALADAPSAAQPSRKPARGLAFGPRTPLNVAITRERGFAAESLPLAELKAIATATQTTLNDVVLALCGGALRRYLARVEGLPKKSLVASMPISLRDKGDTGFHTKATLSLVSLATHLKDPLKRLQAVRGNTSATKSVARQAKSVIPTDFPSMGVPWLVGALAYLYGRAGVSEVLPPLANVLISNVPGPAVPLYVGQARMTGYWPLSIVEHGLGLNITLMSYAGRVDLGFTVARSAVPEVRQLADDFLSAYAELKAAALAPAKSVRKPRAKAANAANATKVLPSI